MKSLFFMLALTAGVVTSAQAQSNSKFDKNYSVCYSGQAYKLCSQLTPSDIASARPQPRVIAPSTYVSLGDPQPVGNRKSKIRVTYDDPNAPYRGENSMVNDGVKKNVERNTNYLDQSVALPANDGGLSRR